MTVNGDHYVLNVLKLIMVVVVHLYQYIKAKTIELCTFNG